MRAYQLIWLLLRHPFDVVYAEHKYEYEFKSIRSIKRRVIYQSAVNKIVISILMLL